MKIVQDGDSYMVYKDGFKNLMESEDYFFITAEELSRFDKAYTKLTSGCECACNDCLWGTKCKEDCSHAT